MWESLETVALVFLIIYDPYSHEKLFENWRDFLQKYL